MISRFVHPKLKSLQAKCHFKQREQPNFFSLIAINLLRIHTILDNFQVYTPGLSFLGVPCPPPSPDFGRLVNPISTKGGRLCPPNNTSTPGFSDLPTALYSVQWIPFWFTTQNVCISSTDRVTLFKRNYHLVRQKNPCCTANTKQQAKPLKRDQIIFFYRELALLELIEV